MNKEISNYNLIKTFITLYAYIAPYDIEEYFVFQKFYISINNSHFVQTSTIFKKLI